MPFYSYRCDSCGEVLSSQRGDRVPCPRCGLTASRRFSFRQQTSFREHFNNSTGTYVTNQRQFRDDLKRGAEEATRKTGVFHDYEPVDYADREKFGITDEHLAALEPTYRAEREALL